MLKNPISELALFFDLEWVPDAASARRLFDLPEETTEIEAMESLWKHASKYDAKMNPRPFIKYMFSRVVSIAFLSRRTIYRDGVKAAEFKLNSFPELPFEGSNVVEVEIIERFLTSVGKYRPQLVGYNSSESDMQVLIQRGMINELTAGDFCKRPKDKWDKNDDYFARWDNECHLDLLKHFSNRDMTPKLDEFAKICGYPGKIDVKGDQVTDLWLAGNITKIVEYNQIDTLNTYLVWLRMVYFVGLIGDLDYHNEQDQFREFLENEAQKTEKKFLAEFLAKWPL
jgi:predicted PolB exonuclease-like 3'-5' exonuclease